MKILIVTQYFYPEAFRVNTLCAELVRRGHEVTVLTGYPQYPQGRIYDGYGFRIPYEREWNGATIERIKVRPRGRTPLGLLLNCATFVSAGKRWVKRCRERFDAVYVFEVSPVTVGLPAVAYKEKFGTPIFFNVQDLWPENVEVVLGIHNKLVIGIINRIVDTIYTASDRILCSSEAFVRNITARGVSADKPVFWPQFCAAPELTDAVKPTCYEDGHCNIVFAGNLGEAQGLDLLIDAAARLTDTPVRWFLIGDGQAKARLKKRVTDMSLGEYVHFIDRVSEQEANRYIHFADCAYLSFQNNALFDMTIPAKLQSYLACGTPILGAVGGESADIIRASGCGFVSDREPAALEHVVRTELLTCDELPLMRERGRNYFATHFTMERLVDQLESIMTDV